MKVGSRHKLLQIIAPYLPPAPTIIEAGAYKGHDSLYMAKLWPNASFHLFEPVPELFAQLESNTQHIPQITRWPLALSSYDGTATFNIAEKKERPGMPTQAGSILRPKERIHHSPIIYPRTIEVPAITLDTWALQQNVETVDFLWLDAQGHELDILKHGTNALKTTAALFVELHFIQAYEGQPLAEEIITWLDKHGFIMIGRDYTEPPRWFFGNGLFIRRDLYTF